MAGHRRSVEPIRAGGPGVRTRAACAADGSATATATAFRDALPFPQFLAFIAIGIAALVYRAPDALSSVRESAARR